MNPASCKNSVLKLGILITNQVVSNHLKFLLSLAASVKIKQKNSVQVLFQILLILELMVNQQSYAKIISMIRITLRLSEKVLLYLSMLSTLF